MPKYLEKLYMTKKNSSVNKAKGVLEMGTGFHSTNFVAYTTGFLS